MKRSICLLLLAGLLLTGCGTLTVRFENTPIATTIPGATSTRQPPATPVPPAASATPVSPTEVSIPASPTASNQMVKIFLIAMEDNGKSGELVGCGDSVVPVQVEVPATQGVLKAAVQALLALKDRQYGESGLYNALYQSDLHVDKVAIENGKATVEISGTMMLGGECDDPRVEAQIVQTALQFDTVKSVDVFINGKTLKDALSLK